MAMFSMHLDKAPGPDGFNPGFYQKFWPLVGEQILSCCRAWLERGELPDQIRETTIILLPKGNQPTTMKDWRPISLF
ncbi:Transposon TX1 uncharacterized 149 kDa protein [Linum grandiflorum]